MTPLRNRSNQIIGIGVLLVILMLFMAACGGTQATSPTTQETSLAEQPTQESATLEPTQEAATEEPTQESDAPAEAVSFSADVLPILQDRCVRCHGGQKTEEGLDLTSFASLMAGSSNGEVIASGDAENSFLIQQVVEGEMPKRGNPLTAEQIQILTDWVNAGAEDN